MKRILIFSLAYYPNQVSGAEVAIKEITDRIDPSDIEFHIVTLRYNSNVPKVSKEGNVLVHRIGITSKNPTFEDLGRWPLDLNKPLYQFLAAWKALWLHRKYSYDATWAMMAHSAGVPATIFKMVHPRIPFVLTLQEGDPPEQIERTMRPLWPLFKRAFTRADVVQTISVFLKDWARRRGAREPIVIIPNGASMPSAQEYAEQELDQLRREVGYKEGQVFIVSVSRLVHQKAIDIVIRALALLPAHIRYLVVGEGPERESLGTLAESLGVADRVIFIGQVDRTMTAKYRKIARAYVVPSRSEGQGISFLSTMAARLPMVATQVGGIADFLFDAKRNPNEPTTGWAVDVDNPEQVAEAVQDILTNPQNAQRVAETACEVAARLYNWDTIARDMRTQVFGRVLKV